MSAGKKSDKTLRYPIGPCHEGHRPESSLCLHLQDAPIVIRTYLPVTIFLTLFASLLSGCTEYASTANGQRINETPVISLMEEYSQASVDMLIKGEQRSVLLMEPPSVEVFPPIKIPPASILKFGVGVSQDAWLRDGDGMTFELSITSAELPQPVQIYSRYADPKNILEDQRWFDERVSLSEYAGREIAFILTTSEGEAGDTRADWGGWSGLEIFSSEKSNDTPAITLNFVLAFILAFLSLGLVLTFRKLTACAHKARALRMTFSLAVISVPLVYGCYSYLSEDLPAPMTFFLGAGVISALYLLCATIIILMMCGAHSGKRAVMNSAFDIALFNLALVAMLTETGLRAIPLLTGNPLVASDPKSEIKTIQRLNEQLEPLKGAQYENGLFFNSMGFPDREFKIPKPDDTFRIAALADSFGVMPMMPNEYNHLTLLENELKGFAGSRKIEVANLGMAGISPAGYLAILEELGGQLNPDLVVMYFFLGNDFVPFGSEQVSAGRWDRFEIYRVISRLRRTSRISFEWDGVKPPDEVQVTIPGYIHNWRLEQPFIPRSQFLELEQRRARFFDPNLSEVHFAGAIRYIESIAGLTRELTGKPLVMFVIPEELQVDAELRDEIEQGLGKKLDVDRPLRYLQENLSHLGDDDILIVDLLPPFRKAQQELERVYFLQETHWNVTGNRVGAEEAARQLRNIRDKILPD